MDDIGQGVDQPLISPTFHPLFSNKLTYRIKKSSEKQDHTSKLSGLLMGKG